MKLRLLAFALILSVLISTLLIAGPACAVSSPGGKPIRAFAELAGGGAAADREPAAASDDPLPGTPINAFPYSGYLYEDDDMIRCIQLRPGEQLNLQLYGSADTDFDITVYTAQGETVANSADVVYPELVEHVSPAGGLYIVNVHAYSGSGSAVVQGTRSFGAYTGPILYVPSYPSWLEEIAVRGTIFGTAGIAGKSVVVERQAPGSASWIQHGSATTDSNGQAFFTAIADKTYTYRMRVVGGATSPTATADVVPYVSIDAPVTARVGRSFVVQGYVGPEQPAIPGAVRLQCFKGSSLKKTINAGLSTTAFGNGYPGTYYAARFSLPSAGKWTIRAVVASGLTNTWTMTDRQTVWVNRPSLSISSSGGYSTYRRSIGLSSTLKRYTGKRMKGARVLLQQSYGGYSWTTVRRLRTNSKGRVSARVKPKAERYYRFYYPGNSTNSPRASSTKWVRSCWDDKEGTANYTDGYWTSQVWLTKGKHQFRTRSTSSVQHVYLRNSSWGKVANQKHIPANRWRTYYVRVPSTGWYYMGWKGLSNTSATMHQTVW
ncbi:MAG: hypothetical protein HGB10_07160 [Coriobacteriia bacterium]|nr:hypothetical protein [Coriobacteriia bacterium]